MCVSGPCGVRTRCKPPAYAFSPSSETPAPEFVLNILLGLDAMRRNLYIIPSGLPLLAPVLVVTVRVIFPPSAAVAPVWSSSSAMRFRRGPGRDAARRSCICVDLGLGKSFVSPRLLMDRVRFLSMVELVYIKLISGYNACEYRDDQAE